MEEYLRPINIQSKKSHRSPYKVDLYSENRLNSDSSDICHFLINPPIAPNPNESLLIQLESANIPHSFHMISSSNNKIYITEDLLPTVTITLQEGNFSIYDLLDELNDKTASSGLSKSYVWSYNKVQNMLQITQSTADLAFSIEFKSGESPYKIMGFSVDTYDSDASYQITSIYPCNLVGVDSLYIHSNIAGKNLYSSKNSNSSLLAKISVDVDPNYMIQFKNKSKWAVLLGPNESLNDLWIYLRDSDNNRINLRGLEWNLTLLVSYTYPKFS